MRPVSSAIDSGLQAACATAYGITRTLYVLAVGVPAITAQTLTVTTPEDEM
jgi:hypothetical protein